MGNGNELHTSLLVPIPWRQRNLILQRRYSHMLFTERPGDQYYGDCWLASKKGEREIHCQNLGMTRIVELSELNVKPSVIPKVLSEETTR